MHGEPTNFQKSGPPELTKEEIENPQVIFESFFESFTLNEARLQLQEAMELVVKKKFGCREYSIEEDNVRFFFEKMEKVVAAAWLMRGGDRIL